MTQVERSAREAEALREFEMQDLKRAQAAEHRARRERIATAIMAALVGNPSVDMRYEDAASDSLHAADVLIAMLDKEQQS